MTKKAKKPESEYIIPATIYHTDDSKCVFDALPWFEEASHKQVLKLADTGWNDKGQIANVCTLHDKCLVDFFRRTESASPSREYLCTVSASHARHWLQKNRPEFLETTKKVSKQSELRAYLLIFNSVLGTRDQLIDWADNCRLVRSWRTEFSNCLYLQSRNCAADLASHLEASLKLASRGCFLLDH